MKLLQKTSRYYLLFSAGLLLIAGTFLFFELTRFIDREATEKLLVNKDRIVQKIQDGERVSEFPPVIEIDTLPAKTAEFVEVGDTLLFDPLENEAELFRQVSAVKKIGERTYRIVVRQVALEPEDYLSSIGVFILLTVIVLFFGLYFINRRISSMAWQPFHSTLRALEKFSVENDAPIPLPSTSIDEFQSFNRTVDKLIGQVRSDYEALKSFTINASHEIQTPLAILQLRLEEALQVKNLPEEAAQRIFSALEASKRLSQLNRTLLLLAKIEQHGQEQPEQIHPAEILETVLSRYQEFLDSRKLLVEKDIDGPAVIKAHPIMLEILMSNLLSNAIKYSPEKSTIRITVKQTYFVIENQGPPLKKQPAVLFKQFEKDDPTTTSPGLGLSIVKKICDLSGWKINYTVKDQVHTFSIEF